MYGEENHLWIYGFTDMIRSIKSVEGVQQGCPLSTWAYSMALLPFIKNLSTILNSPLEGIVKSFVDDLVIAGTPINLLSAIDYIENNGKYFGYKINYSKSVYLLGKAHDNTNYFDFTSQLLNRKLISTTLLFNPILYNYYVNHIPTFNEIINPNQFLTENFGVKLLGTFIGTKDYLSSKIGKYIDEIIKFKNNLIVYPHHQSRQIILLYSFCNKLNYIFRTTNLDSLDNLIQIFTESKINLLLKSLTKDFIDDIHIDQAMLPIRLGGLGIIDSILTANSANIAGFLSSYHEIQHHFPQINNIDITFNDFKYIKNSIAYYYDHIINENNVIIDNNNNDVAIDNMKNLIKNYAHQTNSFSLQKIFTNQMLHYQYNLFKNKLEEIPGCQHLTWFTSIVQPYTGSFLLATPKYNETTFSNAEFSTALSLRLFLPLPTLRNDQKCNCKNNVSIDSTGHHLTTGCNVDGMRQSNHQAVQQSLNSIFTSCGLTCRLEEKYCFNRNDPNNKLRPDISIINSNIIGYDKPILIDISITSPFTGITNGKLSDYSIINAKKELVQANKRHSHKLKKYSELSTNNDKIFMPFIMETSGAFHPAALNLLKKIMEVGSTLTNIPYSMYFNNSLKRLSCVLQKSMAKQIHRKLIKFLIPPRIEEIVHKNINCNLGIDICSKSLLHDYF
jgi:hypothetical protein